MFFILHEVIENLGCDHTNQILINDPHCLEKMFFYFSRTRKQKMMLSKTNTLMKKKLREVYRLRREHIVRPLCSNPN